MSISTTLLQKLYTTPGTASPPLLIVQKPPIAQTVLPFGVWGIRVWKGLVIQFPNKQGEIEVLQPIDIHISQNEDMFVATSPLFTIFEMEETMSKAVLSYLYSLAEELTWLRENKESLSAIFIEELKQIETYIRLG